MSEQVTPRLAQVTRRDLEVRAPGERLEGVRRIVVARDDRLGDVVLSLPVLSALRQAYPSARLALMVRRELQPLGRLVTAADDLLEAGDDIGAMRRELETHGTDLLVCVSRRLAVGWAGALAHVPHRIGTGYRLYSALFSRRVSERRRAGERHELEYALSFAHRAGAAAGPARFPLAVPDEVVAAAKGWLRSRGVDGSFVLLHPGTGGSCPAWPPGHFVRLAGLLAQSGIGVVVSIGPADAAAKRAFDEAPSVTDTIARTEAGIPELIALIQRAGAFVSNSTGPLHLAAALEIPVLGFYAPWPTCGVERWGPYASNGWALIADHEGAKRWNRDRRRRDGAALLAEIEPRIAAEVTTALVEGRSLS